MRWTALALAPLLATAATAWASDYHVAESISGPDGSWDYARVDSATQRLYVARSNAVTEVDLPTGQVRSFGELQRGHAVVPLPDGDLLATSGSDGTVRFFDTDGKQLASVPVGKKPDAAILDASGGRALVMNSDSGTVSVLDVATMQVLSTIQVKPSLEYAALVGDTLFINNEDLGELETVDIAHGVMGKPIPLTGCEGPTGLAYDAKNGRLISACDNGKAAIVDASAHKLLNLVDIGRGPDAVIIDAAREIAFIPCGEDGMLDILSLASPSDVTRIGRVTTEIGARTGALDPATGAVYLPTGKFGPPTHAGERPVASPGSFHVLVVRPT